MITTPSGRRAAQQFDDLLEGRITDAPAELTALIEFAERAWAVPAPTPRADFTASLRERLMAEAPSALADAPTDNRLAVSLPTGLRKGPRRVAAAVAVLSVAGAATGTAFAAESALPGDTLYPIKQLVESTHAAISFGDDAKGGVELHRAATRLEEATTLAQAGDSAGATDVLKDFVEQATKGADLLMAAGEPADIHAFTLSGVSGLAGLSGLLPTDVLAPVLQTLLGIDKAVTASFPDAGDGITQLPTTLNAILTAAVTAPSKAAHPGSTPAKPVARSSAGTNASTPPKPSTAPSTSTSTKTSKPKPTSVGDAVGDLGDTVGGDVLGGVGGAVSGVGSALPSPLGDVVGGVGDTVSGVGGAVGDTLDGVGGLLNGGTGN
ncbi:DUF5667 domain-containing protein [Nocardioides sp. Kera G14]|uniref:DUF5667 domain-containing protein n=1 Tax=Nocardioides sp. Kera G14 TaxID=2884264 RepID=UPI001D0F6AD6|nr:DUF5667 domain-containing protein [Nocardioides sp. Kera G14]UDY23876.1 DUF5667 domain-containing protein [Nocardioides sp. Kera G14]